MTGERDDTRHELVLTFDAHKGAHFVLVRCRCMTGPPGRDALVHSGGYSRRFFNYDWLARVELDDPRDGGPLVRALAYWQEHRRTGVMLIAIEDAPALAVELEYERRFRRLDPCDVGRDTSA